MSQPEHSDKSGVVGPNEAAVLNLINTASDLERVETATAAFDLACKYGRRLDASAPSATFDKKATLDAAAKAVCSMCKSGEWPLIFGHVFKNAPSLPPEWHHIEKGGAMDGGDLAHSCHAAVIHALKVEPLYVEESR